MGRLFGTDGVRGIANKELTPDLAYKLGKAGAYVLTKENKHAPKIIIGRDTRLSGYMLESALAAGVCSVGGQVIIAGVMPTPAIAYLIRHYKLDAGVVISASHNAFGDNGIKFFNADGYKLPDAMEDEIEDYIFNRLNEIPSPTLEAVGDGIVYEDCLTDYIEFLKSTMDDVMLSGLNIAVDCANGAVFQAAPSVLFELKANVSVIHNEPDGQNINAGCGSTHMKSIVSYVLDNRADVGLAFDGDGDRCHLVDELGNQVDGDQILSICANYLLEQGKLKHDTLVATIMSNLGLFLMGEKIGMTIEKTSVGDRYVLERMLAGGFNLGGEKSGHVIFLDYNTTGDGILTALQVLKIMKLTGKTLSQLNTYMENMPQVLVNANVSNDKKYTYMENETVRKEIEALNSTFAGRGRVVIRPSGTESYVRVMIEGSDENELLQEANRLKTILEAELK